MKTHLKIGFIINPLAGIGGALALKGSDSDELRAYLASASTDELERSQNRAKRALAILSKEGEPFEFLTWAGAMGENALRNTALQYSVIGHAASDPSTAADTQKAVEQMLQQNVDIVLFAGGDGTARNIYDSVAQRCPVLGIPAGVKMQSGVFAVSPEAAGELLVRLAAGGLINVQAREVRDIDEAALREDIVRSRFHGDLLVPGEGHHLQHTKIGGREDPELAAADIAQWLSENLQRDKTYFVGPGSTTAALMAQLNLPNTLLGVDIVRNGELLSSDANETQLWSTLETGGSEFGLIVSVVGGQGFVFGRGNQQFSPRVIRRVGLDSISIVATKAKISALEGRPLFVDTNDAELDSELAGYYALITGYDDRTLYRVSHTPEA